MPTGGHGTPDAAAGGYGAPQGGYGAPQGGYGAPQGGYGAPQGGYGAPQGPYGWPPGGHGPTGPSGPGQQGTNGLAIAALISGLLGFLCVTAVAAVVLGVVALWQIRRTGSKGRGLAIAGIVLGVLWVLGGIVTVPAAIDAYQDATASPTTSEPAPSTEPTEPTEPTEEETTTEPAPDSAVLVVGDCVDDPAIVDGSDVPQTAVVDCAEPHYAEAYAEFDLPEGDYPGEGAVTAAAEEGCDTQFAEFVGMDYQQSVPEVFYYFPTETVWLFDRGVVCILIDPSGEPITGTLQGANR